MAALEKNLIPYGVQSFADLRRRGTTVHFLYLHYRGFTQNAAEEVEESGI